VNKNLPYALGDIYYLPVDGKGYAQCVVAAFDGRGSVLGYFYDSNVSSDDLRADDAVLIKRFGDLCILEGRWRKAGCLRPFERSSWPVPKFRRSALLGGHFVVEFDENLKLRSETNVAELELVGLPDDGLSGCGHIEKILSRVL
jgi:hypothetical protein